MALTYDANSAAPPVSGEFNLEVVINSTGTGDYPIAQGYQGVLIETPPGKGSPATLTMLHGNYGLVDGAGNDRIFLGDGSESIGGALGDTLASGTGLNQFLDGHLGNQSILGGTAGTETILGRPRRHDPRRQRRQRNHRRHSGRHDHRRQRRQRIHRRRPRQSVDCRRFRRERDDLGRRGRYDPRRQRRQ